MKPAGSIHQSLAQAQHRGRVITNSADGSDSFTAMMKGVRAGTGTEPLAESSSKGGDSAGASCPKPDVSLATLGHFGKFIGRSTGTGQCVALVQATTPGLGTTASWVRGDKVQGNTALVPGTAIATFSSSGHYANATDGSSHSAIYLSQNADGMQVLDQWNGKAASVRTIPWNSHGGAAANTGSAFHVVNSSQTASA